MPLDGIDGVDLVRWCGVRCYIHKNSSKKLVRLEPVECDLSEVDDPLDLIRFWSECLKWSLEVERDFPGWKVNGAATNERDDPEEHQHYYKV